MLRRTNGMGATKLRQEFHKEGIENGNRKMGKQEKFSQKFLRVKKNNSGGQKEYWKRSF